MFDTYKESAYGKAEWQCTRSKLWVIVTSLLYALLAAMTIIYAMNGEAAYWGLSAALVIFCVWRIHRIHMPVVVLCPAHLLVLSPGKRGKDGSWLDFIFKPVYLVVEYKAVAGFSRRWNEIYLGSAAEGGMSRMAVPLAFVSRKNKAKIVEIIERKQRE